MQGMRIRAVAALACGLALLAIGCSDQASITDSLEMKKGPPLTEAGNNNLSFPVIWSDGVASPSLAELAAWAYEPVFWRDSAGADCAPYAEECVPGTVTSAGAFQPCVTEYDIPPGNPVPDEYLCYYGPTNLGIDEETGEWNLVYPAKVWWLQERAANKWQMFHMAATASQPFVVSAVDFGDLLESANLNMKQVRTEVALFLDATTSTQFAPYISSPWGGACTLNTTPDNCFAAHNMSGAVPGTDQSIDEVQGTDYFESSTLLDPTTVKTAVTLDSNTVAVHATVYPRCSRLLIQRLMGTPAWNPGTGTWDNAATPSVNLAAYDNAYTAEINAGGSMIFGYNWKTKTVTSGIYRLTFVIDGPNKCSVSNTVFDATTVLVNEGNLNHGYIWTQADLALLGGDEGGLAYIDVYVGK